MNILITGGAGFIGSHLAEYLISQKNHVYIIDDLSTGSLSNLKQIRTSPYLHFFPGSILDESLVRKLIDRVESIYHLAASVGVKLILQNPLYAIENNVTGTAIICKYASRKRIKTLIASTSEVYGKSKKRYFSEQDDLIIGPTMKSRWSYACSKIIDEHLALSYFRKKNLPMVIIRFFNTIGERQTGRYGMVVPRFLQQAMNNRDITIYGDGKQSRCFCYVQDVIPAIVKLMRHPKAVGEIYNIGSTEMVSINELADRVIKATHSQSKKIYISYQEAYPLGFEETPYRMPDIKKIKKLIGFYPKYKLDQIILIMKKHL